MTVTIFPKFISLQECEELSAWTEKAYLDNWLSKGMDPTFRPTVVNRYGTYTRSPQFQNYPDLVYSIYDRITESLGLADLPKSVRNGGVDGVLNICMLYEGNLFPHTDFMEPNGHLFRCNIVSQAPESGGELYVEGNKFKVDIGDLHCFIPSKYEHYVSACQGNINRISWMFGYQLPESDPRFSRFS